MKPLLIITAIAVLSGFMVRSFTPSLTGAWTLTEGNETTKLSISENYTMQTTYTADRFLSTNGGTWERDDKDILYTIEFDTQDSTRVGQTERYRPALTTNQLTITGDAGSQTFTRSDDGTGSLAGLWRITGRENNDGHLTPMQREPRKTLKLLTGTRFQWAAINPQTKHFFGTGGGMYTLKDGKYTETIDFFSRDNSRVGRSLTFDAELKGSDWLHRGLSSTGGKVSEIWSRE